jgi:hypothetical protein
METRQELLLKFMLALASNADIFDYMGDKDFTKTLASCAHSLVDEYYKQIG